MKGRRRKTRHARGQWLDIPAQIRAEAEVARVFRILDQLERQQGRRDSR